MSIDVQSEELIAIFAAHIRRRRKELGLNQTQVVERINDIRKKRLKRGERLKRVFVPYLSDMERGTRAPHWGNLVEFAEALETSPEALIASHENADLA